VFLDVLIDPHASVKDEQHEDGVVSERVVDVVTLLENQTPDTARLMVELTEQGIAAQVLQDEAVNLVLKGLGIVLRVVRVVQVYRSQAFACGLRRLLQ